MNTQQVPASSVNSNKTSTDGLKVKVGIIVSLGLFLLPLYIPLGLFILIFGVTLIRSNTGLGIFFILASVFMVYYFDIKIISMYPRKILIEGNNVTTFSVWSKRYMDLTKISSIKTVRFSLGNFTRFYSLKLTDTNGKKLYLNLGAYRKNNRVNLYSILKEYLSNPSIQKSSDVDDVIKIWGLI